MTECDHNCASCSDDCQSRQEQSFAAPMNGMSRVKRVIGVASGKGGVGKSALTCLLAAQMSRMGFKTAVLDADITGPSVPQAFGVTELARGLEEMILPAVTEGGIKLISVNLLLEDPTSPVIWRGVMVSNVVKQFWTDVLWEDVDVMFVDMPPGTGDVPLTVFQSLPIDGVIIAASPQQLVGMIVSKAVNMARMMNVGVLGLVENMSYALCPHCGEKLEVFGKSAIGEVAAQLGLPVLARLPILPQIARLMDEGRVEEARVEELGPVADLIAALL